MMEENGMREGNVTSLLYRRRYTKYCSVKLLNTTNFPTIITEFVTSLHSGAALSGSVSEGKGGEEGKWLHNAMTTGTPGIFIPSVRISIYGRDTWCSCL
jgi:hypothetical protein